MSLTLRDIDYFLAVVSAGGLAQAAAKAVLTQSTLSKAVQRLENDLGLQLFEPNSGQTRLTTAGQRFLGAARNLSACYGDAIRVTSEMQRARGGLLRIGFADMTRAEAVADALSGLLRAHPKLRVRMRVGQSDRLMIQAVRSGELDIAVLSTNVEDANGCDCTVFGIDRCRPVVRAGHPLSLLAKVELADLQDYEWVFAAPQSSIWRALNAVFASHKLKSPRVAVQAETYSNFHLTLIRATDLITLAPLASLRQVDGADLHVLDLPALQLPRTGVVMTRAGAAKSPLLIAFKDAFVSASADD
ncbi:LysR family transcriptional regulator [Variovorax sp. PAMC26660]|uniref:LysR family transcriptional regulator n=1 Tax=Variovorax sp. PAMC26660 TaxID=2762322 RepID=UPI00164EBB27|nr:LysR family transcriptional regulator [Variovorax sp. PAMC26660]QNK71332.1 LysR family transcriptional regulator [Variovorax sp. PAMC26660]